MCTLYLTFIVVCRVQRDSACSGGACSSSPARDEGIYPCAAFGPFQPSNSAWRRFCLCDLRTGTSLMRLGQKLTSKLMRDNGLSAKHCLRCPDVGDNVKHLTIDRSSPASSERESEPLKGFDLRAHAAGVCPSYIGHRLSVVVYYFRTRILNRRMGCRHGSEDRQQT